MKQFKLFSVLVILLMALAMVGTAFAGSGAGLVQDPSETPEDGEEECAPEDDDDAEASEEPSEVPSEEPSEVPSEEPSETPTDGGEEDPCDDDFTNPVVALLGEYFGGEEGDLTEEIEEYHEDGIGLGVLVKLYAISEETGVPVDQLVEEFKGGKGMGQFFKEYGKPDLLGVGHVKKAMGLEEEGETTTTQGQGKDKEDKDKGKGNGKPDDKGKPDKEDKPDKNNGKDKDGKAGGEHANGGGGGSGAA